MSTANAKHAGNRRKLTRAEKKEIAALIRAAKGDGKAHTAQQTIPYLAMYPDGICKVTEKKYSKSIAYDAHIDYAAETLPVSRFLINQICSTNNGGSFFNSLSATTTLGCGSWGNNSISENLSWRHLFNVSRVAKVRPGSTMPTDEEIWG